MKPLRERQLSERILFEYRRRQTGDIGRLARKFGLTRREVKHLINSFLSIGEYGEGAEGARRSIARFNKKWRGR